MRQIFLIETKILANFLLSFLNNELQLTYTVQLCCKEKRQTNTTRHFYEKKTAEMSEDMRSAGVSAVRAILSSIWRNR